MKETEELIKYDESQLKVFEEKLKMIKVQTWYLYWCKDIKKSEKCVTATYMSFKKAKCCSSEVFAFHLIADIKSLAEHTKRIITQYRQIKGIKKLVADESRKSLHIRVDWSKNGKHYQATQQEEAYYHKIQVSINVVVAYMSSNVTSHCTISDI